MASQKSCFVCAARRGRIWIFLPFLDLMLENSGQVKTIYIQIDLLAFSRYTYKI